MVTMQVPLIGVLRVLVRMYLRIYLTFGRFPEVKR
jgi:hypothetical protein